MNKILVIGMVLIVIVFGGMLFVKNQSKILYLPHSDESPLKLILQEPPKVDQIKKDLSGKTVVIAGKNHQFTGPELNYMNILTTNPIQDGLAVDVQVCADSTIVQRSGLMRKSYTHENVCGSVRVYYDKKDGRWVYKMVENIDLKKILTPNAKAPPVNKINVYKFQ